MAAETTLPVNQPDRKTQWYELADVARAVRQRAEELGLSTDRFAHLLRIEPSAFDAIMNYRLPDKVAEDVLCKLFFGASIGEANPMVIMRMSETDLTRWLSENGLYVVSTSHELSRIGRNITVKNKRVISLACALLAVVFVVIACLTGAHLYELVQAARYTGQQLAWQLVYVGGATIIALWLFISAYEAESEWRVRRT